MTVFNNFHLILVVFEPTGFDSGLKTTTATNNNNIIIAAYRNCRGDVHVTDRARVQPIGRRLSLRPQTKLRPTNLMPPLSAVNALHPRNPWITTHLPTPKGWKAELAWLVDP